MLPLVPSLKHQNKNTSTDQLLRCEAPDFIYFHTSLKHELTKIIFEIIVIEETVRVNGGPSEFVYSSTGYAMLNHNKLTS